MHVISQNIDGGTTEADGGANAPVGPSVATPLLTCTLLCIGIVLLLYVTHYKVHSISVYV